MPWHLHSFLCMHTKSHIHTHTLTKNHNVNLGHNALCEIGHPSKTSLLQRTVHGTSTCCQGWGHGEPCHCKPRKQMRQVYYANSWLHGHFEGHSTVCLEWICSPWKAGRECVREKRSYFYPCPFFSASNWTHVHQLPLLLHLALIRVSTNINTH